MDEKETKCPICDYVFPSGETPQRSEELPETSVPSLLSELKSRIQSLGGKEPEESKPPVRKEEPPTESRQAVLEEETVVEEEGEEKVEEEPEMVFGAEAGPRKSLPGRSLTLPGMRPPKAEPAKPVKQGYKISASEVAERKRRGVPIAIIAIVIVAIILFTAWYFLASQPSTMNPTVDGYFDEWTDSVMYQSYFMSNNADLDFMETSIQSYGGNVYWYFQTNGPLFNATSATSPLITTYALFVDADGNPGTGFSLMDGFGADEFLGISGCTGQKNASLTKLYEFVGTDTRNWSSWRILDNLTVGTAGSRVETSFHPLSFFNSTDARFIAVSYDGISIPSASLPFSTNPGILLIKQTSIITSNGNIAPGINRPVLQVDIAGFGSARKVHILRPELSGLSGTYNLGPVDWNESTMGEGRSFLFTVNATDLDQGKFVQVSMTPTGVVSDYSSVVIIGSPAKGYVYQLPTVKTVDGLFKDWVNLEDDLSDSSLSKGNDDINVTRIGNETINDKTFFYVEVLGRMMNGTLIPVGARIPGPNMPSGIGEQKLITGEDTIRIYIDRDPANNTGAPSPINGTNIRPDLMVEISGKNGEITEQVVKYWTTGWYRNNSVTLTAAYGAKSLELSISVGHLENATFLVVTTDWAGRSDNITGTF